MNNLLVVLPRELLDIIQTFFDNKDASMWRLVNKSTFQQIEDTIYGYEASALFGSRWFQNYFWCYWCCAPIPVHNLLCKEFQCCETCEPHVLKTCSACSKAPVSILCMKVCERCEHFWCQSCADQLFDIKKPDCEYFGDPTFYCYNCLLYLNYYFLCNNMLCSRLLCNCMTCLGECYYDYSSFKYCSETCREIVCKK